MKILLLHKYAHKSASFRCRLEQYLPYLKQAGHECSVESLLSDKYLEHKFKTGKRDLLGYIPVLLNRLSLFWRVADFDLVVICLEFLPYFPAIFERYLKWRKIPYIFDYDDAVFHYYDLNKSYIVRLLFKNKFDIVLANAAHVIGGSSYLVDYAKRFNQNVSYVPTVVDSTIYNKTKHFTDNPTFTIGWIGSPSTAVYLNLIVPALKSISATQNVRIVLIGAGNFSMQGISFEAKEWSEQDEIAMMLEFDVGIMPLSNDEWSKGKCGFKLIQYMACGLPVIASPVGVNTNIVTHGENGFLANAINDWEQALVTLINNKALCQKMGQKGRVIFEKHYSLAVNAPKLINIISTVKDNRLC